MDKCAEAQISFCKQRNAAVMGTALEGRREEVRFLRVEMILCESSFYNDANQNQLVNQVITQFKIIFTKRINNIIS